MRGIGTIGFIAAAVTLAAAGSASADAIDGNWCRDDGRRMEIEGARISTPGGNVIQGDYTRHAFRYVVPEREEHGGTQRFLRLRGENTVHAFPAEQPNADPEVWRRCTPVS
jgi:hypothetical protein